LRLWGDESELVLPDFPGGLAGLVDRRVDGWYAGAVAIWGYNARYWDWNSVPTRMADVYSYEPDPTGYYCRWSSLPPHNP
jgi:hypothetical protein